MAWGAIAGAVVGGLFANQAAKKQASAMDRATAAAAEAYRDARPYFTDLYSRGKGAMENQLDAGYYQGPTYAGLNNMQTSGLQNQYNLGQTGFGYGNQFMNTGASFGSNYNNLYNQAGQDQIGNAINYANANSQPLVDAALRDSTRNLQENTLQSIGMGASSTGNINSSKAAVAQAIAGRDYLDRAADTSAGIRDRLAKDYLTQQQNQFTNQMAANQGLSNTFNTGFDTSNSAVNAMQLAGGAYQKDLQNQYEDARARFEGQRDYESNLYGDYRSQILDGAPRNSPAPQPNYVDPTMAALSGAMAGYGFGAKYFPTQQAQPYQMQSFAPQPQYINSSAYQGFGYVGGK